MDVPGIRGRDAVFLLEIKERYFSRVEGNAGIVPFEKGR